VLEFLLDIVGYPYLGKKKKTTKYNFKKIILKDQIEKKTERPKKKIGAKSLSCNSVPNV
jgi:hypothetical protein